MELAARDDGCGRPLPDRRPLSRRLFRRRQEGGLRTRGPGDGRLRGPGAGSLHDRPRAGGPGLRARRGKEGRSRPVAERVGSGRRRRRSQLRLGPVGGGRIVPAGGPQEGRGLQPLRLGNGLERSEGDRDPARRGRRARRHGRGPPRGPRRRPGRPSRDGLSGGGSVRSVGQLFGLDQRRAAGRLVRERGVRARERPGRAPRGPGRREGLPGRARRGDRPRGGRVPDGRRGASRARCGAEGARRRVARRSACRRRGGDRRVRGVAGDGGLRRRIRVRRHRPREGARDGDVSRLRLDDGDRRGRRGGRNGRAEDVARSVGLRGRRLARRRAGAGRRGGARASGAVLEQHEGCQRA